MGYVAEASKRQLVIEICSASKRTGTGCDHLPRRPRSDHRFVDWYLLLGVKDDADADAIRKCYRRLALQVHPDKNDHPDAELAFKLLLEAYKCLSDAAKRKAFDAEKQKNACRECLNLLLYRHPSKVPDLDALKDIRDRFREESRVIENCMRRSYSQCDASPSSEKKESPVFDPLLYEFTGYPHVRSRVDKGIRDRWRCRTATDGSPVFGSSKMSGSDGCLNRSRSVCLGS
ncbi:hypothetical protein MLD38_016360 [Melastoma candidum]|uniref:Uncharacterized protein n=1 Tax=Melastoma candidum TaxID=119954 RepID=A0ACB9RJ05_9MYRT|nr:hypothetical protein MLD38_016360 [Melastoma candidum]